MRFKAQLDGKEHEVLARPDGSITVDGKSYAYQIERPDSYRTLVQIGEKSYDVRVVEQKEEGGYVLEIAGERVAVTVKEVTKETPSVSLTGVASGAPGPAVVESPRPAGESRGARGQVTEGVKEGVWAPVPGKIVNVHVQVGDRVKEGQAIVVLEAMKMENELHAPADGTVTAVLVKKGDQVERGQLLVALE